MKAFLPRVLLGSALALSCAGPALAGLVNDVPSCYQAFRLPQSAAAAPDKLVYVLIDQTVRLTPDLERSVLHNINGMIQPGSKFVEAEFSAFSQGRYLKVLHTGVVERPLPRAAYDNIPITKAPDIKACFKDQQTFAEKMADTTAMTIMNAASFSLDQSDIMAAIQDVGQAIAQDPARRKTLFLVTDGLENSSVTSFYGRDAVRNINPAIEFQKAQRAKLLARLAGVKVYVLGAGLIQPATHGTLAQRNGYRDPTTMAHLKSFWTSYFKASGAQLKEFGEPALVESVSY